MKTSKNSAKCLEGNDKKQCYYVDTVNWKMQHFKIFAKIHKKNA